MRRLASLGLMLALAGCVQTARLQPGATYVSLGSSFAAGPGLGQFRADSPKRCQRSELNYAALTARRLDLRLVDASCGGATTAHILGPWNELPPQIDAVAADTALVTVTIGGNDLGLVRNLYAGSCDASKGWTYQGRAVPCPTFAPPTAEDFARLENNLRQIARDIRTRAPRARIVFIQYVKMVPDVPCTALGLSPEGTMLARNIAEQLARGTSRAAEAEGASVLPMDQLSRGHTPCDAEPWSVGPAPQGEGASTPWHHNRTGMAAIADALTAMLSR